ncbi:hypothetical protein HN358_01245 [Candidatus Uhrbacteria bacterium]|jgi:hypothetical protein|nr:hypothetical protein [Candidatus Uhrbacteria bacterium]MBT7717343.1 hypothetical protein [Candidatus Uhrbacteria bacterium]
MTKPQKEKKANEPKKSKKKLAIAGGCCGIAFVIFIAAMVLLTVLMSQTYWPNENLDEVEWVQYENSNLGIIMDIPSTFDYFGGSYSKSSYDGEEYFYSNKVDVWFQGETIDDKGIVETYRQSMQITAHNGELQPYEYVPRFCSSTKGCRDTDQGDLYTRPVLYFTFNKDGRRVDVRFVGNYELDPIEKIILDSIVITEATLAPTE